MNASLTSIAVLPVRPRRNRRAARSGVTLFELLVVIAITAIVVTSLVRLRMPAGSAADGSAATALTVDRLIDSARTLATRQAVTVGLRVYPDGLWSIVIPGNAEPIAAGQMRAPQLAAERLPVLLTVDPLGACRPDSKWSVNREGTATVWDARRCRWRVPDGRTRARPAAAPARAPNTDAASGPS